MGTALEAGKPLSSFSSARPAEPDAGTQFNVEWATHLIDGVVLQPGEVFSFNRTLDKGRHKFRKGKSFYAGRVIMSTGGGYCQVSTTLYNATLLANQEVIAVALGHRHLAEAVGVEPREEADAAAELDVLHE